MKHVAPIVEERLEKEKLFGADWAGKSVSEVLEYRMVSAYQSVTRMIFSLG